MSLERFGFFRGHSAASQGESAGGPSSTDAVSSDKGAPAKRRHYNAKWGEGCEWLEYSDGEGVMFCAWCRLYDKNDHRNQFVHGCSTMKVESIKKHEHSQQHKDAEASHHVQKHPDRVPMEVALQHMAHEELDQMKKLFNTAFYLVQAERPFSDFPGLLHLQVRNGLSIGNAYCNEKQAKIFISFIADEIRSKLVQSLHSGDFFSISFDSSMDKGNIDEEMVQVRVLENGYPVYRFVAVKPLSKPDAVHTATVLVNALEADCELSEWKLRLVGLSADGAAVNMGIRSGVAKRLQDLAPHLVPVHCCAHRVELAIKTISSNVSYFKTLEDSCISSTSGHSVGVDYRKWGRY